MLKALLNPTINELDLIIAFHQANPERKESFINSLKENIDSDFAERFCIRRDFVKDFILAYDNNKLDMIISNIITML